MGNRLAFDVYGTSLAAIRDEVNRTYRGFFGEPPPIPYDYDIDVTQETVSRLRDGTGKVVEETLEYRARVVVTW